MDASINQVCYSGQNVGGFITMLLTILQPFYPVLTGLVELRGIVLAEMLVKSNNNILLYNLCPNSRLLDGNGGLHATHRTYALTTAMVRKPQKRYFSHRRPKHR